MCIRSTWWTRPYPEYIRDRFHNNRNLVPLYLIRGFVEIWKPLTIMTSMFLVIGFIISGFAGSLTKPWELPINTMLYSFSAFLDLFTHQQKTIYGGYIKNLASTYMLVSIVVSAYASRIFERRIIGRQVSGYFTSKRMISSLALFSFLFMLDNTVAFLVKTCGLLFYNNRSETLLFLLNITTGLFGSILLYFIMTDIFSEVIVVIVVETILSALSPYVFIPSGLLVFYLLTILSAAIRKILERLKIAQPLSRFVAYWCYTPQGICRLVFFIVILCIKLVNGESYIKHNRDADV